MRGRAGIVVAVAVVLVVAACRPFPQASDQGSGLRSRPTGFFRTRYDGRRWWLVTPDGRPFYATGINHVGATGNDVDRATGRCPYCEAIAANYPSVDAWADATVRRLRGWGFNTLGSWSEDSRFGARMPYTALLHMATSGDWFAPDFVDHANQVAAESVAPRRDDPNLIGWATDSELRWGPDWRGTGQLLDEYLAMPAGAPGRIVADQHVGDPMGFLRVLAERYFSVTTQAIRRVDPHHLVLGVKQIAQLTPPEVLEAARRWVDVFSVDDYVLVPGLDDTIHGAWPFYLSHDRALRSIASVVHKPLLVMEYSFRAADAGVPNSYPPIFPVYPDQAARAAAADTYLRSLYAAPWIVGDHWFEYVDEPAGGRFDTEDSNFGLVSSADRPWSTLVTTLAARHAREPDRRVDPEPVCWSWRRITPGGRVVCSEREHRGR
jgi:agarase